METITFSCGCSITKSMFGKREVINIWNCGKHSVMLQKELKALNDKIIKINKPK